MSLYANVRVSKLAEEHQQAVEGMQNAIVSAGSLSTRALQLWQAFVAAAGVEEATASGAAVYADAVAKWGVSKTALIQALDATAAAMGTTRAALAAELAE